MPVRASAAMRANYLFRKNLAATHIQSVVRRKAKQKSYKNLKLSKPVATLVQRRIDKGNPSRFISYHQRRYQFSNLISDAPLLRLHTVIPDIAQGNERNDRVGAKLKLNSINIKGRIDIPADDNPILGNDDRAQIYVRMFVLSVKNSTDLPFTITADWNTNYDGRFFKDNANPTAPTGDYKDMLSNVNREVFTVHYDRVMKLDRNYPFFPDPTSTSGAASQRPVSKEFNVNLKVKNKQLMYSSPTSVQPQNFRPFVCCLFAYGNGAAPSTSEVPYIEYLSKLSFKD